MGTKKFPSELASRGTVLVTDKLLIHNITSGATEYTTVAELLASLGLSNAVGIGTTPPASGLNVSGNITTNGNIVVGASGYGTDFSSHSHAAGMTSQLLDDYEEGTFAPTVESQNGVITSYISQAQYVKVGSLVQVHIYIVLSSVAGCSGYMKISGLPFYTTPITDAPVIALARETEVTGNFYNAVVGANSIISYVYAPAWVNSYKYALNFSYRTA